MKGRFRVRAIDAIVLGAIVLPIAWKVMTRTPRPTVDTSAFVQQIDLAPFQRVAVHSDGRLRSFESHAKTHMGYVSGPRSINRQTKGFTYLDLMFRSQRYLDIDIIYIKNKLVRSQIIETLRGHPRVDDARAEAMNKSGLISRMLLETPGVAERLQHIGRDLIRGAKPVNSIRSALNVSDPRFLSQSFCVVPPPSGRIDEPWLSVDLFTSPAGMPSDGAHAGLASRAPIPGMDKETQAAIGDSWTALRDAWAAEDAVAANVQIAKLADLFPAVSPRLYPSTGRLEMESWYFRTKSMNWVWLLFLSSVIPLLMSVIYKWNGARTVGLVLFVIAFGFQTASLGIRWYISGRWPNANMFEAVTTAAWFGGLLALILEWIARRTLLRNLFVLGAAVMSMGALMAGYFLPASLSSAISNKMAALNDVWLYIHTNMIIWSYAVIGLACVPALLLMRHRWCLLWDRPDAPKIRLLLLPVALGVCNYAAYALMMHAIAHEKYGLSAQALIGMSGAFVGSGFIIWLAWLDAQARTAAGGFVERSASGGASVLLAAGGGSSQPNAERPLSTEVFDGATMVLVELAFIMLWVGVVMGAIWADHSWGRPWGWDPKEVFALNTFIIFLVLVHVRLKVRDPAFWTAVLAVVGFEVMMFNWVVVNFVITGLHSYA